MLFTLKSLRASRKYGLEILSSDIGEGLYIGHAHNINVHPQPCYYFQKLDDMLVFTGQRGELAVCKDPNMRLWHQEHLGSTLMYYYGFFHQFQVFNDYILLRK